MPAPPTVALFYDDSAYRETLQRPPSQAAGVPHGIMGRQVAGKEFLDAYLTHGAWKELAAVTPNQASSESLIATCRTHPSSRDRKRRLQIFPLGEFHSSFLPQRPAQILHLPHPLDARFAWARQAAAPHGFALSGVTHTLCSAGAIEALRNLLLAPFESYDRLICTSRAVVEMVEAVSDVYQDFLRERFGGDPRPRVKLERIPLGVNTEKFRPPSAEERRRERERLHTREEELLVLFVGRLAHHAKAHPFPMFHAVAQAAERTGKSVHLVLMGWAASPAVLRAFQEGARTFAPQVRTTFLDGADPENRFGAWKAADVFASLSDNIQETFGLVIVEAMASGLPVVASDWNGYRDLVVDGQTGFLAPTAMVRSATRQTTARLLLGEVNYDHFLAECSQAAVVDCAGAADAFTRLFADAALRRRLGDAGRRRAVEEFDWSHVVRAYEAMWGEQDEERRDRARQHSTPSAEGPSAYPAPERTFAGYPTRWLEGGERLRTAPGAVDRLKRVLQLPLTNHEAGRRCADAEVLRRLLDAAQDGCAIADLDRVLEDAAVAAASARATLAWMAKYDLLRPDADA